MTLDLTQLRTWCQAEHAWQMTTIEALTRIESPSHDKAAVDRCGAELTRRLAAIGGLVTTMPATTAGDHVRAEFILGAPGGSGAGSRARGEGVVSAASDAAASGSVASGSAASGERAAAADRAALPQVLLLGHFDTVWPIGTLDRMPIVRQDGRLHGPGVFDMKAGIAIGMLATRALRTLAPATPLRIVMVWTTDEEVGSTTSRALIEDEARKSRAVFVLEPSLPGGALKTARKGVGEFTIEVEGVSAHAGIDPSKGVSAIHELAAIVGALAPLNDLARGTSVNVGVIEGGTRTNVIAERARAQVDVRTPTADDARRVDAFIRALQPTSPKAKLTIAGGIDRPPLERSPGVVHLYELARDVARGLGLPDLAEGSTGGGSDGNFTAALGVPTLDGLGAVGDGAHARHEHIEIDALVWRTALLAGLMARLAAESA